MTTVAAEVRQFEPFATTSAIYTLWGKENGDKMVEIFQCESHMKQWDNQGNLLTSSTSDVGISQINQIWWPTANQLGYSLDNPLDNITMAYYVWIRQGFGAWTCSKIVGVV